MASSDRPTSMASSMFFFFFSSRRRHTRCYRDWSSDVCSSDLARQLAGLIDGWKNRGLTPDKVPEGEAFAYAAGKGARSEERRVGKECRSRGWADHQKKKGGNT